MKAITILCFSAIASAATIKSSLHARQLDLFGLSGSKGTRAPFLTKKLTSQYENGAVREKTLWGPFKINAANGTHAPDGKTLKLDPSSDIISTRVTGLCSDCMVLYAQADIANINGSKADISSGVYSHHIIITDVGRPLVKPPIIARCPDGKLGGFNFVGMMPKAGGSGMAGMSHGSGASHTKRQFPGGFSAPVASVFVGQGDDGTATLFSVKNSTVKSGFYISKTDSINLMSEVINYDNREKEIYISLEYEYLPNMPIRSKDYYDVGMGGINVQPCGSMNLSPPGDKPIKYASPEWDVIGDGYLLDIKPHLHDGGLNMTFYINGKSACTSSAVYGTSGATSINGQKWETIGAYTPCTNPVAIKKGDKLTMEAYYDLTKHRLRPTAADHNEGAEGMALATFLYAKPV